MAEQDFDQRFAGITGRTDDTDIHVGSFGPAKT
jgi:hypothetical protein